MAVKITSGYFRNPTKEEKESIIKYIKNNSHNTNINFSTDYDKIDSYLKEIREYLTKEEILAALAEEASELSQAALKMRRVLNGTNPTPVSILTAKNNLIEEIQDVNNCIRALGYESIGLNEDKIKRWITRLEDDGK